MKSVTLIDSVIGHWHFALSMDSMVTTAGTNKGLESVIGVPAVTEVHRMSVKLAPCPQE
jgi:hypothetical protein